MTKKNKIIVFSIIPLFVLIIVLLIFLNQENILRNSFEIKISGNYSSSGASRKYDASIVYKKGVAVSGTQQYSVWEGGGCTENCNRQTTCIVSNQKWIDSISGGECNLGHDIYLSKAGIVAEIENKELKSIKDCSHSDTCYQVL